MRLFSRKEEPKVVFASLIEGLDEIEEVRPRPAIEFLPSWWKTIPKYADPNNKDTATAKACPALPHYFNSGFIVPMWQDTTFIYNEEVQGWTVKAGRGSIMEWENHPNYQLLDHTPVNFLNKKASFIFKANSPWLAFTPKGWSLLQVPLFYNFDSDYTILPGIIDTDVHHEINQQVAYFGDGKEVTIKRGEPFVQYIPVKRKSLGLAVRSATQDDRKKAWIAALNLRTKFTGSGNYKKMRVTGRSEPTCSLGRPSRKA